MSKGNKIDISGGGDLGQNPFANLGLSGLKSAGPQPQNQSATAQNEPPTKNRGRLEIRRLTCGRGGKTVTQVSGFVGIGQPEKEQLAKKMQKVCGCGGTVKDGAIEIQGDKREQVAAILSEAGFRPVMAGG